MTEHPLESTTSCTALSKTLRSLGEGSQRTTNKDSAKEVLYQPLAQDKVRKAIRILELSHTSCQESIVCFLKQVWLTESPHYEALSYCWGDRKITKSIIVNGAQLPVTNN